MAPTISLSKDATAILGMGKTEIKTKELKLPLLLDFVFVHMPPSL